jgi:hypothetical protein
MNVANCLLLFTMQVADEPCTFSFLVQRREAINDWWQSLNKLRKWRIVYLAVVEFILCVDP